MDINSRIAYFAYLVVGVIFIIAGLSTAINEPQILVDVYNSTNEKWYEFLMPWVGNSENGLPTPW